MGAFFREDVTLYAWAAIKNRERAIHAPLAMRFV